MNIYTQELSLMIYQSDYLRLEFMPEEKLMKMQWLDRSCSMSDKTFKQEFLKYAALVKKHRPSKLLFNTGTSSFTINPKMQAWLNDKVFPVTYNAGLRTVAFIVSRVFITQLSLEQTVEEEQGRAKHKMVRFFGDINEAMAFLRFS
ncbi:hypothetical protein R9C00_09640 [Flammeovirgaceae bacterium SG7u.111]|nr:hypothetical protein [Flammeovirgaceae bacterium SG7u.132]WPO37712.1 hypothetical protein R9C00_09640 [Flammeovirgaceae bacterium SG7u.111]